MRSFPHSARENLRVQLSGIYLRFGEQLYLAPEETPVLRGLKVLRPGLHLGTVKKNRFEPSHALALTLKPEDAAHAVSLDTEGRQVKDYLNGLTFPAEGEKGWYLICADGCSLGWGKLAGGIMKNHYPKGLPKKTGEGETFTRFSYFLNKNNFGIRMSLKYYNSI